MSKYKQKKLNSKNRKISKIKLVMFLTILILFATLIIHVLKIDINKIIREGTFPEEVYGVKVHTDLISQNSEKRPGIKRSIKYIVIHETGNQDKGADAKSHANLLTKNSEEGASWHYTVDDKEIYHHLPDDEVGWHAGDGDGNGNTNGIGIELCVNSDGNFEKTFENAAKLVAYLLKEYHLSTKDIKMHEDFVDKKCPEHIIEDNRMPEFIKKVEKLMK